MRQRRTAIGDPLTDRQREVLCFLAQHVVQWQRIPTRLEIARRFGWASPNSADEHLYALEQKGAIRMEWSAQGRQQARYPLIVAWPAEVHPVVHAGLSLTSGARPQPPQPVAAVLRAPAGAPVQA